MGCCESKNRLFLTPYQQDFERKTISGLGGSKRFPPGKAFLLKRNDK